MSGGLSALRQRLERGEVTFGTFLNVGSPIVAEMVGVAGFEWAVLDLEHGSSSEADLVSQLQALQLRNVVPVVRVESNDRPRFSFALDRGAAGIMVPRIEGAADASAAVSFMRYPPEGVRGIAALNRACDFGMRAADVIPSFNDRVLGLIMIETSGAVESIDDIALIPGVDILFVGPSDLSHALGVPGNINHPRMREALLKVTAAAAGAQKIAGIIVPTVELARRSIEDGFRFIAVGSDSGMLLTAMVGARSALVAPQREASPS